MNINGLLQANNQPLQQNSRQIQNHNLLTLPLYTQNTSAGASYICLSQRSSLFHSGPCNQRELPGISELQNGSERRRSSSQIRCNWEALGFTPHGCKELPAFGTKITPPNLFWLDFMRELILKSTCKCTVLWECYGLSGCSQWSHNTTEFHSFPTQTMLFLLTSLSLWLL